MPKLCSHCGIQNRDEAIKCIKCGESLRGARQSERTSMLVLLDQRYEIKKVINSGAMGCVYKAKDTRLGGMVAVKKMLTFYNTPEEKKYAEDRFMEEAKLLSQLHHSGLPKVIDFFITKDPETGKNAHYLVMTFVEGKTLNQIINENNGKPFPLTEAVDYFRQILEILHYLHTQNPPVIYRDTKPSNIMIQGNRLFLVDFGIARAFKPEEQGTMVGTPGFAAPEQYQGFAEPRSDLYSLGVVMHFLLSGIKPYGESRVPFQFEPLHKINPEVPPILGEIISAMLSINIDSRPESALAILQVLDAHGLGSGRLSPSTVSDLKRGSVTTPMSELMRAPGTTPIPGQDKEDPTVNIRKGSGGLTSAFPTTVQTQPMTQGAVTTPLPSPGGGMVKKILLIIGIILLAGLVGYGGFFVFEMSTVNNKDKDGMTRLHYAVIKGDLELVKYLLARNADVNVKDNDGNMPLHLASKDGKTEIAQALLNKGAFVKATNNEGNTPLHTAGIKGNKETAALLVGNGADINILNNDKRSPLHITALNDNVEVCKYLIEGAGAIPLKSDTKYQNPLHLAVLEGHTDYVKYFVPMLAPPEVNFPDIDGNTPLHYAAQKGNLEMVKAIVERNECVLYVNNQIKTPIDLAKDGGFTEVQEFLEEAASKEAKAVGRNNLTYLHEAVSNGNYARVEVLLKWGADVNARTTDSSTPLHFAAQKGDVSIIKLLLDNNADVNAKTQQSWTPLIIAVQSQKPEAVKAIASYRQCDLNAQDLQGNTAMDMAKMSDQTAVVAYLKSMGAKGRP